MPERDRPTVSEQPGRVPRGDIGGPDAGAIRADSDGTTVPLQELLDQITDDLNGKYDTPTPVELDSGTATVANVVAALVTLGLVTDTA